jgi:hypothetical protein
VGLVCICAEAPSDCLCGQLIVGEKKAIFPWNPNPSEIRFFVCAAALQ